MPLRLPKPRLRLRGLAALVALAALMTWAGLYFWSPTRKYGRLLRAGQPEYVRRDAAALLGRASPSWEVDEAVGMLVRALDDPSPRVREQAAAGLAEIGPRAAPAIPRLIAALNDRDRFARYTVAAALGMVTPPPSERDVVLAALTGALDDPDPDVGLRAAESLLALGEMGKAAGGIVSALGSAEDHLRERAKWVLRTRRGSPAVRNLIVGTLRSRNPRARDEAVKLLVEFGSPEALTSALAAAAVDADDPEVRRWAAEQAEKYAPLGKEQSRDDDANGS